MLLDEIGLQLARERHQEWVRVALREAMVRDVLAGDAASASSPAARLGQWLAGLGRRRHAPGGEDRLPAASPMVWLVQGPGPRATVTAHATGRSASASVRQEGA